MHGRKSRLFRVEGGGKLTAFLCINAEFELTLLHRAQKSPYLPSQYSLFNGVTAAAMEVIEKGSIRRERQAEKGEAEEGSNIEEVLVSLRRVEQL